MVRFAYIFWGVFLLAPCFTTNILEYFFASDVLAFSAALLLAAYMFITAKPSFPHGSGISWFLLVCLLLPGILNLMLQASANPWGIYRLSTYIIAVFVIFRMSQNSASYMINSITWVALLAVIGNLYALLAMAQMIDVLPKDPNSLYAIWNHAIRFSGVFLQPNLSSLFFDIVIVSLLIQGVRSSFQSVWFILSILPMATVLASNSRSGMLLLAVVFLILWIQSIEKKKMLMYIISTLVVAIILALYWNNLLQDKGQEVVLASRLAEGGFSDRISLWYSAFHLFTEHPILGIGYGNFPSHFAEAQAYTHQQHPLWMTFSSVNYWAHNLVLHFFAEGGLIGGIGILMMLYMIARKGWYILHQTNAIHHPQFSSFMVVSLIVLHGMVSISFFQGFFLSLFGLYLAGLFSTQIDNTVALPIKPRLSHVFYTIPAIYAAMIFYQLISTQVRLDVVFDDNPDSPRFIEEVSKAIDNPWTARPGLEYLLANMELTHAPAYQWVNVYPYIFHSWQLSQDPTAFQRLILQAHLADNALSEKYWGEFFLQAYPNDPWGKIVKQHIDEGHMKHEPLRTENF